MSNNQPQATPQTQSLLADGWLNRLAWLPIPLLLAAMAILWAADLRVSYESPYLVMALSFVFFTLMSVLIAFLMGRSFVAWGTPGLLLLGCGIAIWGVASPVGVAAGPGDANIQITIHNTCVWLSALCHLAGVILSFRSQWTLRARGLWLGASYVFALSAVGLIALAAIKGWLPVFFVQGQGGTPARQFVLGSAITLFALTAVLLWETNRPTLFSFVYWYALSLLLFAVGLFGVMIQSVAGSPLGWTGRVAQFLSGVYMLMAALASRRELGARGIAMGQMRIGVPYRFGVAIVLVIAAAAVRLVFLRTLETHSTFFVTFYPAVVLAAFYGGLQAGFLATVLSALLTNYFWMEPVGPFGIGDPFDWSTLAAFLASCTIVSWIVDAMQRAQARIREAETQAQIAAARQRDMEALRESEERFQTFMDNSPGIAWIKDEEGRHVYLSKSCERRFGVKLDDWRGKTDSELWPSEIARNLRANDLAVLRDGQPRQLVEEVRNADGVLSYWLNSKFLIRDAAGRKYVAGSGVDITERKRMEEALRVSEERWRALMDHVPMPVQGYNSDGIVTYWNRASERLYGFTSAEAIGRNLGDLIVPSEVKPHFRQALLASLSIEASGEFLPAGDIELLRKDGSLVSVLSTHTAVRIPGYPPMLFCLDMDLTERKKAEEAVQTALNRFYSVLSNMSLGVLLITEDGRVEFANQTFCDMFNMKESPADLESLTSREIIERIRTAYSNPEEAVARIREIVDRGQPVKDEDVLMRGERTFLRDFVPIRLGEKKFGRLWIHKDITDRKRAVEALRENEQRLREARGLLEAVTFGAKVLIATVDKDFRYTFFNREHHEELKRLTGKETTLGMSLMEVLAEMPEERDKAIALWSRALKGETVVQTMMLGDPGRYRRWYNTRHVPIRDVGGAIVGAGEVTSDVTEFMRAQEALRESEERLRLALDAGAMATWDWHIPSGEVIWNDEHYRMLGYEVGEVKPSYRAWADRMHPDDAVATEAILRQSMERGAEYSAEFRVLRPDGTAHWIEARGRFERDGRRPDGPLLWSHAEHHRAQASRGGPARIPCSGEQSHARRRGGPERGRASQRRSTRQSGATCLGGERHTDRHVRVEHCRQHGCLYRAIHAHDGSISDDDDDDDDDDNAFPTI